MKVIREEMLRVAANVAKEKNLDNEEIFDAMEQALEKAATFLLYLLSFFIL